MKKRILNAVILLASVSLFNLSCKKELKPNPGNDGLSSKTSGPSGHLKQTKTFTSDVVVRWLDMQLNLLRVPLAPNARSAAADRAQGYCGITAYEAVVPGMPAYQSLYGQLIDFPAMPTTEPGKAYHWAASANAALAEINRQLFPDASPENKTAIDNLENTLEAQYAAEVEPYTLARSIEFGKEVATRIYGWANPDFIPNTCVYVDPTPAELLANPGLWVRTNPMAPAVNPCSRYTRFFVPDVSEGTELAGPPPFSITLGSAFHNMALDVYNKKNNATDDQLASAYYYRDAPGYPGGGSFAAIYSQLLAKAQPTLDVAALGYAKVGMGQHEATLVCFNNKYNYLLIRPVTYIQKYIDPAFLTHIPTPNHPEYPSGHSTIGGAVTAMYADIFGENFQITLHTYDYIGLPPRSYDSFTEMATEMANSRVFGGIHYQATCNESLVQGKKVAMNILEKIKFKK